MPKCKHPSRLTVDMDDCIRCRRCGQHMPLGPSNDDVPTEEILAAELGQNPDVLAAWLDCSDRRIDRDLERFNASSFLSLGHLTPDATHLDCDIIAQSWLFTRDYWAGWLAREMSTEPVGIDWDVTRPLEEQWPWNGLSYDQERMRESIEDHDAHMARGDAMLDEVIAEQTRHDVAASVVRHDALEPVLTDDEAATIIAQSSDSFAPVDTASREPWHADVETQESEADAQTKLRETES